MATEDVTSGGDLAAAYPLQTAPVPPARATRPDIYASPGPDTDPAAPGREHGLCLSGSAQAWLCSPQGALSVAAVRAISESIAAGTDAEPPDAASAASEDTMSGDLSAGDKIGRGPAGGGASNSRADVLPDQMQIPDDPVRLLTQPVVLDHPNDGALGMGLWRRPVAVQPRTADAPIG